MHKHGIQLLSPIIFRRESAESQENNREAKGTSKYAKARDRFCNKPFPISILSESDTGLLENAELSSLNIVTSNQVQQLNIHPQYLSSSFQICSGSMPTATSTKCASPHLSVCVTMSSADLPPENLVVSIPQCGNPSFVPPNSQPTPIAHASFTPQLNDRLSASSFQVKFLKALIKVCAGCGNGNQR